MSGFAAGFGTPKRDDIETMFLKIHHRGPDFSGIEQRGKVALAQNYLAADVPGAGRDAPVPVGSGPGEGCRIAYDGQIGNAEELATIQPCHRAPFIAHS